MANEDTKTVQHKTAEEIKEALSDVIPSTVDVEEIIKMFEDLTNITIVLDWGE